VDWTGRQRYRIGSKLLMFGFDNKKENMYGSGIMNGPYLFVLFLSLFLCPCPFSLNSKSAVLDVHPLENILILNTSQKLIAKVIKGLFISISIIIIFS